MALTDRLLESPSVDEDDEPTDDEECVVCGNTPCDCDDQYDRWRDSRLDMD